MLNGIKEYCILTAEHKEKNDPDILHMTSAWFPNFHSCYIGDKIQQTGSKKRTRASVSYLSQLRRWISFGVGNSVLDGVKLRQHHLPLLIVDEDNLLLLFLLLFITSSLPVLLLNLLHLLLSLLLNCSSTWSGQR